jgi:hypothetical protein
MLRSITYAPRINCAPRDLCLGEIDAIADACPELT